MAIISKKSLAGLVLALAPSLGLGANFECKLSQKPTVMVCSRDVGNQKKEMIFNLDSSIKFKQYKKACLDLFSEFEEIKQQMTINKENQYGAEKYLTLSSNMWDNMWATQQLECDKNTIENSEITNYAFSRFLINSYIELKKYNNNDFKNDLILNMPSKIPSLKNADQKSSKQLSALIYQSYKDNIPEEDLSRALSFPIMKKHLGEFKKLNKLGIKTYIEIFDYVSESMGDLFKRYNFLAMQTEINYLPLESPSYKNDFALPIYESQGLMNIFIETEEFIKNLKNHHELKKD